MSNPTTSIPTLYAEMTVSRPSVMDGKQVKVVAFRLNQQIAEGLYSGRLLKTDPTVFGHQNDGFLCERLLSLVPRELLHPEATVGFRIANQYGFPWEREHTRSSISRAEAREAAERLFRKDSE